MTLWQDRYSAVYSDRKSILAAKALGEYIESDTVMEVRP